MHDKELTMITEIWTTKEAARFLKRSENAIRNLTVRRAIPYRKVAGRLVFIPEEILEWMQKAPGVGLGELAKESLE